jgi:hypothetical protein
MKNKLLSCLVISALCLTSSWTAFAAKGDAKRLATVAKAEAKHFKHDRINRLRKKDLVIYRGKNDSCNVNIASNTSSSIRNVDIKLQAKNITVICKR